MFLEEYKEIYIANKKKIEEWERTKKQLTEIGRGNLTDKKRAGLSSSAALFCVLND